MGFKCGFVAVVGRPNAGKSTLVNRLVGRKVAIVSPRPQTTRNRIQGIVNRPEAQIVLVDTPGIHKPDSVLNRQMMDEVRHALEGIDALALVVDAAEEFGAGDRYALDLAKRFDGPTLLLLNKTDRIEKPRLLPLMERYAKAHTFADIFPISALSGDGVEETLSKLMILLPDAGPLFPPDQYTDQPERFLAAELVREKAITRTRAELPHAVAVLVDSFEEGEKLIRIRATIFVEREGQKGIVIGKRGEMLKRIGSEARKELEELLGVKIFLELFVKVQRDWRDKPALVRQLDWRHQLESLADVQSASEEDPHST